MLLEKFQFIPPEKYSGFEPKEGAVKVIRKECFQYVNLGTIIGDAPKCMIALYDFEKNSKIRKSNPKTWRKYIAKSARKWYPNESITEHLINELGRTLGYEMANSCLRRIKNQIWFLSEYFLADNETLNHGADLYAWHLSDKKFVDQIQDDNKIDDQDFFTVQLVERIFKEKFKSSAEIIFQSFIKMLIFDGIIGNNDRHAYNWGIITNVETSQEKHFSPIFDSARGLFWNNSEDQVNQVLNKIEKDPNFKTLEKYVLNSRPKIGWEGEKSISHINILKLIYHSETGISKKEFVNLVSEDNFEKCINVINCNFNHLISVNRRKLITKCLKMRFSLLNDLD
jgi:hypothetical protein